MFHSELLKALQLSVRHIFIGINDTNFPTLLCLLAWYMNICDI